MNNNLHWYKLTKLMKIERAGIFQASVSLTSYLRGTVV